jgi:ATP-binding cassette, subfamily F, member 3
MNQLTLSRGTQFTLSRDELLTLPEFVLLSLFPNGLLPDNHMNTFHEGDVYPVDVCNFSKANPLTLLSNPNIYIGDVTCYAQYDPASLQYMLDFFRGVAQSIPSSSPSPTASQENDPISIEPIQGSARDMLQDRAGIIVLREDLDFYVIPPKQDIEQPEMIEVKRAAGKSLLKQDGIFSGLKRSEETGTTEQHLIEMLTAG